MPKEITVVILLFDRYTALDVVGPYEIFCRMPATTIKFVAKVKGPASDSYGLKMMAEFELNEVTEADVLLLPGGPGIDVILKDTEILAWIRHIHVKTNWTSSVCSGALLLAEAGILDHKNCTTHWRRKEQLKLYPVDVMGERVVQDGKIVTCAGVSAGIDMALFMAGKILGSGVAQQIQLNIEYDPHPPFPFSEIVKAKGD